MIEASWRAESLCEKTSKNGAKKQEIRDIYHPAETANVTADFTMDR